MAEPKNGDIVRVKPAIRMDEVAAIKLSRIEKRLFETDAIVKQHIKDNEDLIVKGGNAVNKVVRGIANKTLKPKAEAVVKALKPLFPATTFRCDGKLGENHDGKEVIFISLGVYAKQTKGTDSWQNHISWNDELPIPKELAAKLKEIAKIEKFNEKLYLQSAEIKRAISRMSTFERKIRADIAEKALAATDEGQMLLDELDLDNFDIPGLDVKLLQAPK